MENPIISVRDLFFSYNQKDNVLNGINLDIWKGDFIALIGQNGCGKTTLSKHFNGIHKPTSGTVYVNDIDTSKYPVSKLASIVGYCYQNPDHQIFNANIGDEIEFGAKNIGMDEDKIKSKVQEVLKTVGLDKPLETYPFSLSKGERQKLAVASILAMETPVIVVDEPSTGLDWQGGIAMMELMKKLNDKGHTMIVITHDMRFVAKYARRVIAISNGRVLADGSAKEVLGNSEILKNGNLMAPQITRFMEKFKNYGINETALNVNEAVDIFKKYIERVGKAI